MMKSIPFLVVFALAVLSLALSPVTLAQSIVPTDGVLDSLSPGNTYSLVPNPIWELEFNITAPFPPSFVVAPVMNGHESGSEAIFQINDNPGAAFRIQFTLPTTLHDNSGHSLPCSFGPEDVYMEETGALLNPDTDIVLLAGPSGGIFTLHLAITVAIPAGAANGEYVGSVICRLASPDSAVATAHFKVHVVSGLEGVSSKLQLHNSYQLEENYPNPFNPSTNIAYEVPHSAFVSLKIYDVLGREVADLANGMKGAGTYHVHWNAANQSSGIYFCRIIANPVSSSYQPSSKTMKMVLAR